MTLTLELLEASTSDTLEDSPLSLPLELEEERGGELSPEDFSSYYNFLRDKEIEETRRAILESQKLHPPISGDEWILSLDLSDPKYSSYDLIKFRELQEALKKGIPLTLCEGCKEIYPSKGYWYICAQPDNFRHGHTKLTPRDAQPNTVTEYFINRRTGNVWIPGAKTHYPVDRFGRPIPGYEKQEVRNPHERDKFYRFMDGVAKQKYFSNLEREEKMFGPLLAENRKQARHDIRATESKSPEASLGREMLERMIRKTESEAAKKLNYSPNTSLDAWEMNCEGKIDGPDPTFDVNIRQDIMQPILQERHKKLIGKGVNRKPIQNAVSPVGKVA